MEPDPIKLCEHCGKVLNTPDPNRDYAELTEAQYEALFVHRCFANSKDVAPKQDDYQNPIFIDCSGSTDVTP
jgi:hypothetical protein